MAWLQKVPMVAGPLCFHPGIKSFRAQSNNRQNRRGDVGWPCTSPLPILSGRVSPAGVLKHKYR
eukprot:393571-Amphidinium_carterae.1